MVCLPVTEKYVEWNKITKNYYRVTLTLTQQNSRRFTVRLSAAVCASVRTVKYSSTHNEAHGQLLNQFVKNGRM